MSDLDIFCMNTNLIIDDESQISDFLQLRLGIDRRIRGFDQESIHPQP